MYFTFFYQISEVFLTFLNCHVKKLLLEICGKCKNKMHWSTTHAHTHARTHARKHAHTHTHTHTHTRLTALFLGPARWAGTRKVKTIWILLKQETVSGSGISWAICKSAPCSKQTTTPAPHHSVFYRPYALPAAQPTASKHWKHWSTKWLLTVLCRIALILCCVIFCMTLWCLLSQCVTWHMSPF